ncbi:unnamed protein product, partial [Didymodactylos carnosus]
TEKEKEESAVTNNNISMTESNVIDLTTRKMKEQELSVLEKGLNFIPTRKINTTKYVAKIIAAVEAGTYNRSVSEREDIVSEVKRVVQLYLDRYLELGFRNLSKAQLEGVRSLKSDDSIIVIPADKGKKVVVMNTEDYIKKVEDKLKTDVYKIMENNPFKTIKKKFEILLSELVGKKEMEKETMDYLLNNNNIPFVRGQVKVHKVDNPMRLIVSMRDTMYSNLSKYLTKITKSLADKVRPIKNTQDFIQKLYKVKIKENCSLAKLDVSDMFTSIDRKKVLNTLDKLLDLDEDWKTKTALSKESLIRLFQFIIENVIFQFRDIMYYQSKGLPMGLSVSPFLADIIINEFLEKYWDFQKYPYSGLARYVDDFFIVSELSESQIKCLVDDFNNLNESLKFEFEYQKNDSISFLDVQINVIKDKLCLETNWYMKPTASKRLLNYESDHSMAIKKNIAMNMIKRIQIANNGNDNENDMHILRHMLANSGYPLNLIKKIFREVEKQKINKEEKKKVSNEVQSKSSVIVIPHLNKVTEQLRHILKKFNVKIYTKCNPSIGYMVNKCKRIAQNNKNKNNENNYIKAGEFA